MVEKNSTRGLVVGRCPYRTPGGERKYPWQGTESGSSLLAEVPARLPVAEPGS